MSYKKLTPEELSDTVAKIRSRYQFYCSHFYKTSRLRDEFENRYQGAIKSGIDISNFLLAEIDAITELIRKEEERLAHATPKTAKQQVSIADKVIEENLRKIEKYPEMKLHKDANIEVKKLAGTLNYIFEELLPILHTVFRAVPMNPNVRDVTNLEAQLRTFAYTGKGNVPPRLSRYHGLINKFPRDYRTIGWEEKEYLRESAFVLHDLTQALDRIFETSPELSENGKKQLVDIVSYLKGVIVDFRLRDIKRKD